MYQDSSFVLYNFFWCVKTLNFTNVYILLTHKMASIYWLLPQVNKSLIYTFSENINLVR